MGPTGHSKIWFITGASQGLGLAMAMAALQASHTVIATARNVQKAANEHPELEAAGGNWVQLDVSKPDVQQIVEKAVEDAGGVDVVINNAGNFLSGSIEDQRYVDLNSSFDAVDIDTQVVMMRSRVL